MERIKLWKDQEKKIIDPLLFSKQAEDLAKAISADNQQRRNSNKRTQLRKFYDEVVRLTALSKSRPDDWKQRSTHGAYAHGQGSLCGWQKSDFIQFQGVYQWFRRAGQHTRRPESLF